MKFRVWDINNKCYVPTQGAPALGDFMLNCMGELFYTVPARDGKGELFNKAWLYLHEFFCYRYDRKMNEMWVGDIVMADLRSRDNAGGYYIICDYLVWNPFTFSFELSNYDINYCEQMEVIGNIHQNSELLG